MHVLKKVGIATGLVASAALSLALALPAQADTAAVGGDVVGVGSDTLQNGADFAFDGAPGVAGGYNTVGNGNRAVNVDATGDANGRALYDGTCGPADSTGLGAFCNGTTNLAPNQLSGSVVLRAGTKPVLRPNGSGAGAKALVADSTLGYKNLPPKSIQFARMSRLPDAMTELGPCSSDPNCGGLHVYQAATDTLAVAHVTSGYDGPSGGLSAAELISIYTCNVTQWNKLPGNTAGSSSTIHPLIPQTGSGTRNFFLADLKAANGGTDVAVGSCVRNVQEHDPTGIYADNSAADAIEPFSTGKLTLINNGYFANGVSYAGAGATNGAYTPNYLKADPAGTAGDSNAVYSSSRGLYFAVRQTDVNSTTPFQSGSTANFVTALFSGTSSAIRSASGQAELTAAGFTPAYVDCGLSAVNCT